jgi:hypothetical protein
MSLISLLCLRPSVSCVYVYSLFFPPIMVTQTGKMNNRRWTIAFLDFNTKEEAAHFMLAFRGTYVESLGPGLLEAS